MSRLSKDLGILTWHEPPVWPGWLPLALLPGTVILYGGDLPRWVFMWLLAFAIWAGCKWLTWWNEGRWMDAEPARCWFYFFAWPGMNVREFLGGDVSVRRPAVDEWLWAGFKTLLGAAIILFAVKLIPRPDELARGWVGLLGLAFFLHFGLFHLLALFWQARGINAQPLMKAPACAVSVGEFWGYRWNVAFNQLVHRMVFRPVARRAGLRIALMATFLVSGLIHDLVISLPARGGYGLPTLYFLIQGGAVLFEHTEAGRRCRLRQAWPGWLFTMAVTIAPAWMLFHPPFIRNVLLPMLTALGAT